MIAGSLIARAPVHEPVGDFSDISRYQGLNVRWVDYFKANFIIALKATEGGDFWDSSFTKERVAEIHAQGGAIMAYHFFTFKQGRDIKVEVDWHIDKCLEMGALAAGDLNSAFDVEQSELTAIGTALALRRAKRHYRRRMRKLGARPWRRQPNLYGGSFLRWVACGPFGMRWWWAAYVSDPWPYISAAFKKALGLWFAWQFTSSGWTKGIDSAHDRSHFRGRVKKLRRMQIRYTKPTPA